MTLEEKFGEDIEDRIIKGKITPYAKIVNREKVRHSDVSLYAMFTGDFSKVDIVHYIFRDKLYENRVYQPEAGISTVYQDQEIPNHPAIAAFNESSWAPLTGFGFYLGLTGLDVEKFDVESFLYVGMASIIVGFMLTGSKIPGSRWESWKNFKREE